MPDYPDANRWSTKHHIQIATVNLMDHLVEGTETNERFVRHQTGQQTVLTNANLQRQLLPEYEHNPKNQSQEFPNFFQDKKSSITILFGQCDEATQTEIALGDNYTEDRNEGRLLAFIERLCAICFGSDDGGLSYAPYEQVVAIKSLNIYTNNDTNDPYGFKEQVKIKNKVTKAIVGRFPNGTATLMHLLSKAEPALDWDDYCALPIAGRLEWETRADALNQPMIYIMNSKNEIAKKDLRLAYFQENYITYPANIEAAVWYLSTQYPNNKSSNQRKNK